MPFSKARCELTLDSAVNGRPRDVEELRRFRAGVKAGVVDFDQVFLLWYRQFGLLTAKMPFRFGHLHSFAGSGANQIRLEFGDHRQDVEEEALDGVVRVMHRSADTQLHIFGRQLVNDVFRIPE